MTTSRSGADTLADAVRASAHGVVASLTRDLSGRPRDEWVAMAADCQSLLNTVTAVQDLALAEAARRESVGVDGTRRDGPWPREGDHRRGGRRGPGARCLARTGAAPDRAGRAPRRRTVPVEADGGAPPIPAVCRRFMWRWARDVSTATAPVWSRRARGRARGSRRCGRHCSRPVPRRRRPDTAPTHSAPGGSHFARPAPATRGAGSDVDRSAPLGVRTGGGRLVRHLPQRGGRRGLGRHRPPGSGAGHHGCVLLGRAGPRQGPHRPRHGKRNGRRRCGAHRAGDGDRALGPTPAPERG